MDVLIFKTNINTKKKAFAIQTLLNNFDSIIDCNIDLQDIDRVLRIESKVQLNENKIINTLKKQGFVCKPLT